MPVTDSAIATAVLLQKWISSHAPTAEIEGLLNLASFVIGDRDWAQKWLSELALALDNRSPIELIGEKEGFERIKTLLMRIECGVLA